MDSTTLRKVINSNRSGPHKPPIGKRVIHYLWAACVARFNHYWWLSLVLLDSSCQYFSNNISDVIIEVSTCLKGIVDFICNSKLCFYFLNILCVIVLIFLGAKLQKKNLSKAVFVSRKLVSRKPLSKLSCVCLSLEKLVNGKHFPVKEKFSLVFRKVFSFYFGRKTLSGSCKKFRNVILFADYIKFDPQTFDCYIYIYFVLNIYFSISSLKI